MLRREYKYLIPSAYLDDLRSEFLPFVEHDKYSLSRPNYEYTIRSIYYDTRKLTFYHEKLEGVKNRKKLRIRGYNEFSENSIVLLEIKRRLNDFIDKNRAIMNYRDLNVLFETCDIEQYVTCKDENNLNDAKRFFYNYTKKSLMPISLVVYDREAFFSKFNPNIRITFDKNLRYKSFPVFADLFDENGLKPTEIMSRNFLLEMKFHNGYPEAFQKIINKFKLKRMPFSKYEVCVTADESFNAVIKNNRFILSNPVWNPQVYFKDAV